MLNPFVLFNNLFRAKAITPDRLYGFGVVVLKALILANDKQQFSSVIETLTTAMSALKKELSDVDTNLNDQKTETKTVDSFIVSFYTYMSENEPFIARALGGKQSAGYLSMYPFGLTEYSAATKTTMPILTSRVQKVAEKYAGKLEPEMAEALQAFDTDFEEQYGTQQTQINTVKQDRTDRNSAFKQSQLVLTSTVYAVGMQYPGDTEKCAAFFPFKMLYPQGKRELSQLDGTIEKGTVKELMNFTLNPTAFVIFSNEGDNAAYAAWLAASPTDPMPSDAVVVNVGTDPISIKAIKLGDLKKHPFFMIKNLSDMNACAYKINFIGLRKKKIDESLPADLKVVMEETA